MPAARRLAFSVGAHSAVLFAIAPAVHGRFFACCVDEGWRRFRVYRIASAEDYFELKVFDGRERAIAAPAALQLPEIQRAVWKMLFRVLAPQTSF